ncbi:hypothetical protein ACFLT4_05815 [Chloroflexota bacterium]
MSGVALELYDPTGTIEIIQLHAPRLADLRGKTICELSYYKWETVRTFPAIRELLLKRFPDVKIIPYSEFPVLSIYQDETALRQLLSEKGCEGVIVGNAA